VYKLQFFYIYMKYVWHDLHACNDIINCRLKTISLWVSEKSFGNNSGQTQTPTDQVWYTCILHKSSVNNVQEILGAIGPVGENEGLERVSHSQVLSARTIFCKLPMADFHQIWP